MGDKGKEKTGVDQKKILTPLHEDFEGLKRRKRCRQKKASNREMGMPVCRGHESTWLKRRISTVYIGVAARADGGTKRIQKKSQTQMILVSGGESDCF